MRLKSAYREKPVEAPNIPEEKIQPSEPVKIDFGTDEAEPSVAIVSADEYSQPDEATLALQKQLADLKKSEELQREYARRMAQQQQQPPTHAALLQSWRSQGADEGDLTFLENHPELMDNPALTRLASDQAAERHQRGTDGHRQATKEIFDRHLGHQQAAPAASVEPTPEFFAPPPPAASPSPASDSARYSAPVSRREAGGYREPSAKSVRLSPIEQEIARNLGLTDVAYAEGKIRMMRAKANGDLQ
jgi:hypothetical protein